MRIAQIAPLYERVPPVAYGGTERIVSYLTEELVRRGHDVTLFASGDSATRARLVAGAPRALRTDADVLDPITHHVVQLRRVIERAGEFDLIHNHMDYLAFPIAAATRTPMVTTLHGRLDLPDLPPVFAAYPEINPISISLAQRAGLPGARWRGMVHHGLPPHLLTTGRGEGGYLAFLGRISIEKRVDAAIRIAEATGSRLRIAAKIDPHDRDYFHEIAPSFESPLVEFVGEIGEREKSRFLGEARALLFPVDWPEPFGLAVIEALACGTPVITRRRGAVPELVTHGRTGFVCDDEEAMIAAVARLGAIDRAECRRAFEASFTTARMADDYLRIYHEVVAEQAGRTAGLRLDAQPAADVAVRNGHASRSAGVAADARVRHSAA